MPAITEQEKLRCLVAHIDKDVYSYISECASYNDAIRTLEGLYVKPCNIIFARHLLKATGAKVRLLISITLLCVAKLKGT